MGIKISSKLSFLFQNLVENCFFFIIVNSTLECEKGKGILNKWKGEEGV